MNSKLKKGKSFAGASAGRFLCFVKIFIQHMIIRELTKKNSSERTKNIKMYL